MTGPYCSNPKCGCHDPGRDEPPSHWKGHAALIVFLLAVALSQCVHAQGPVDRLGPNGEPGVWLPLRLSREALGAFAVRPVLEERIRLTDARLTLERDRSANLVVERDSALESAARATGRVHVFEVRSRRRLRLSLGFAGATLATLLAWLLPEAM